MKVIALRQLRGSYGLAATGDPIEVTDEVGKELLKRKVVCAPGDYQKKVVKPSSTKRSGPKAAKPGAAAQPPADESSEASDAAAE